MSGQGGGGVPFFDGAAEVAEALPALTEAAARVLASGRYIGGPEVTAFEAEAASYLGADAAVAVSSGTDALWLALRSVGVGPGDVVVTTPVSFVASGEAILRCGATPRFVDIAPGGVNLDVAAAAAAVDERVAAVLVVHLFGDPVDVPALRRQLPRPVPIVEDAAQAFGARLPGGAAAGTLGDAAAFSFFPTKPLGGFGDGGLVLAGSADRAAHVRRLRAHGGARDDYRELGGNCRLDALQAALLRVRLQHLDADLASRRAIAARYDAALADVPVQRLPRGSGSACAVYSVLLPSGRRPAIREALTAAGVGHAVYYPTPLHRQPVFAGAEVAPGGLAAAEDACERLLALPCSPGLTKASQDRVVEALRAAVTA